MSNKQNIFGLHAVIALLKSHPERVIRLFISDERSDKKLLEIISDAKRLDIPYELTSRKTLNRMTDDANHQGVIAQCESARVYGENDLEHLLDALQEHPFILILDG